MVLFIVINFGVIGPSITKAWQPIIVCTVSFIGCKYSYFKWSDERKCRKLHRLCGHSKTCTILSCCKKTLNLNTLNKGKVHVTFVDFNRTRKSNQEL